MLLMFSWLELKLLAEINLKRTIKINLRTMFRMIKYDNNFSIGLSSSSSQIFFFVKRSKIYFYLLAMNLFMEICLGMDIDFFYF